MTEKTLTTENIKPALDALRGELAPWPVVAMKQDKLNDTQKSAVNSGITSGLVAQIIANTAAIRALESAITGTGLRALVVSSLPAVGTLGILYIVPVTTYDPATDADVVNYSNEYIWIVAPDAPVTEGYYEQVGQTGIVINNGQLTITVNGTSVGTFTANQSGDTTAAITVPTNADYVDLSTSQTVTGGKTWTGEQSFTLPIVGSITGTASKAIADEDGTSIKTGYGKLAGSQTWTGNNTFTGTSNLKNINIQKGTIPSANLNEAISFLDKNNASMGFIRYLNSTDGNSSIELRVENLYKDGQVDTTGTANYSYFSLSLTGDGQRRSSIAASLLPFHNSAYSLGTSSYRWSSVYADSYYYGTTAWGLDKDNVWTGNNRFSKNSSLSAITSYADTSMAFTGNSNTILFNTRGSSNYPSYGTFLFAGYMTGTAPDRYGQLKLLRSTDIKGGTNDGYIPDTSFNLWRVAPHYSLMDFMEAIRVQNEGNNNYIAPITNNATDLGNSTNKWKTINGLNPGALSLPNHSGIIDVMGDIVPPTGEADVNISGGTNSFTAPIDGWLVVRHDASTFVQIYRNSYNSPGTTASRPTEGKIVTSLPVIKDTLYTIIVVAQTGTFQIKLYPCLGNV